MPTNLPAVSTCTEPDATATFADYQRLAARTHRDDRSPQFHLGNYALGLAGEAGEVADMLKKHLYHGQPLDVGALVKEAGDVLWYLAGLATVIGIPLEAIAARNIAKLQARHPGEGFDPAYHSNSHGIPAPAGYEQRMADAYSAGARARAEREFSRATATAEGE